MTSFSRCKHARVFCRLEYLQLLIRERRDTAWSGDAYFLGFCALT